MKFNSFSIFIIFSVLVLCSCDTANKKLSYKEKEGKIVTFVDKLDSVNRNYYAASTYKPDDELYNPVLAIQRKRWDIAIPLLEKLVNKNNPDAMYWLAEISGGSIFSGKDKANLFKRSAELGNPYAALRLNIGAEDCNTYLKGYCSKEWGDKASKILKDRANKGDIKAKYHLSLLNGNNYDDDLELVLKNAEKHYYYPLIYFIEYDNNLSPELRKKLYNIMVNNYFVPVAELMYLNLSRDSFGYEYYESNLKRLAYSDGVWLSISAINSKFFEIKPNREYIKKMIISNFINNIEDKSEKLNHGFNEVSLDIDYLVDYYNSLLKSNNLDIISKDDLDALNKEALDILNNTKPIIYIDEYFYKP